MTPLAMEVVKDLTRPVKDRSRYDSAGILKMMADVHCFEISAIAADALILGKEAFLQGLTEQQTFLPAPKTWMEWKTSKNHTGILAIQDGDYARCWTVSKIPPRGEQLQAGTWLSHKDSYTLNLNLEMSQNVERLSSEKTWFGDRAREISGIEFGFLETMAAKIIFGALAFINSPRIIGRRTHLPHRGLERELLKQQKIIGKFPLRAWTEILLDVTPPKEAAGQHDFEAHLTGRRALHFVRAHLRIREGKLQFVKAHWRGDASLGIKQSRYRLVGGTAA